MGSNVRRVEGTVGTVYFKRSSTPEIGAIEERIYNALAVEPRLKKMGIALSSVSRNGEELVIPGYGHTLMDHLHLGNYQDLGEMREAFELFLEKNVRTRAVVNEIVNRTLTEEDKRFLEQHQFQKLAQSAAELGGAEISPEDLHNNYWAYRVMNAVGIHDEKFKEAYTQIIGKRLDALVPKYGQWLTDNTLRNNASPDGKTVVPFDFNSIKFGPKQIDDAAVAGLFCLGGPLAIYQTPEEIHSFMNRIQEWQGQPPQDDYDQAFLLATFHENAVIAGYRTRKTKELMGKMEQEGVNAEDALEFRKCFDEIEYHHDIPVLVARQLGHELFSTELEAINYISNTLTQTTFAQRTMMLLSPVFQQSTQIASQWRFGV